MAARSMLTRLFVASIALICLYGCNGEHALAKKIVSDELGSPQSIEFRNLRTKPGGAIVCGDVLASDRSHAGWRYFVAYLEQGQAVIDVSSERMGADAEMGNPLLRGEASRFYNACS
jgi:hypothetical protein